MVSTAIQNLAMYMKVPPIAFTKENLAMFLSTRMKALRADEQKLSLERAQ